MKGYYFCQQSSSISSPLSQYVLNGFSISPCSFPRNSRIVRKRLCHLGHYKRISEFSCYIQLPVFSVVLALFIKIYPVLSCFWTLENIFSTYALFRWMNPLAWKSYFRRKCLPFIFILLALWVCARSRVKLFFLFAFKNICFLWLLIILGLKISCLLFLVPNWGKINFALSFRSLFPYVWNPKRWVFFQIFWANIRNPFHFLVCWRSVGRQENIIFLRILFLFLLLFSFWVEITSAFSWLLWRRHSQILHVSREDNRAKLIKISSSLFGLASIFWKIVFFFF